MNEYLQVVNQKQMERTKAALEKNNMKVYLLPSAAEVVPLLKELLPKGGTVANGGSVTLSQCGVMELLRSGAYQFLDREAPGVDKAQLYRQVFSADAYLASANAVTEQGEIYEVDGNGNRVSAIAFGPANVYLVVGVNKIVPDVNAAFARRANLAAPANAMRTKSKTPCATTGICSDCHSPQRICCTEVILRQQMKPGRINVLLVNEVLGY